MSSITEVGVTPSQLAAMVEGEIWERWLSAEPALAAVSSLSELDALRGCATDGALGALVRLAARDGGDEELAGIAVVHQLEGGIRRMIRQFRNLDADIESLVVGALWEKIRTFPWQRRTSAYAANLIYDTRAAVVALLLPGPGRRGQDPVAFVDPQAGLLDLLVGSTALDVDDDPCDATDQLAELLAWAVASKVVTAEDACLLVELVVADRGAAGPGSRQRARGACSVAAVSEVAQRRGVCAKTVFRRRDQALANLRATTGRYLSEAA
jgi:hypothetical protein